MANVILKRSNGTEFETTLDWYNANKKRLDFMGTVYLRDAETPKEEPKAEKADKKEKI